MTSYASGPKLGFSSWLPKESFKVEENKTEKKKKKRKIRLFF